MDLPAEYHRVRVPQAPRILPVRPMPRNDPTDTGGLFIGRRPGTAPLRYKADPDRAGERRRRTDATLAAAVLALETLVDRVWRILRRAAGYEQQEGILPRIFAVTAIVALVLFSFWFWII